MKENKNSDVETLPKPKTKSLERDCPRCHFIVVLNEREDCFECTNCGYIDCGDD